MIKRIIKKALGLLRVFAPLFSRKSSLCAEEARAILEEHSARPTGTAIVRNELVSPVVDLQIIIPAYNAEDHLEDCMESILSQQTRYSYKAVVIDDGSTDRTPAIADSYRESDKVTVIHQTNKGFSGARNTGLSTLFGKYIMFVDSDDMLCPGAIEALLDTAFAHDCDIVEGGAYSLEKGTQRVYFSHPQKKGLDSATGTLHGQPWAKVFKADCFENIVFPEGFWFEDSIFSFLIYPVKKRIYVTDRFTYIYRINPNGISSTCRDRSKALDTYWITEELMETQAAMAIPADEINLKSYILQLILNQKRIARAPESVQESAFVLSAEMLHRYFPEELINESTHIRLLKAVSGKNWGMFRFYCSF